MPITKQELLLCINKRRSCAGCASSTSSANGPGGASRASGALGTGSARRSSGALRALGPLRPGGAGNPLGAGGTYRALRPGIPLRSRGPGAAITGYGGIGTAAGRYRGQGRRGTAGLTAAATAAVNRRAAAAGRAGRGGGAAIQIGHYTVPAALLPLRSIVSSHRNAPLTWFIVIVALCHTPYYAAPPQGCGN